MTKKTIILDSRKLHEVESELNSIKYKGLEVGNLLSYYFDRLYRNDYNFNWLKKIVVIIYYSIKPVSKKQILFDHKKELIYFRTGDHRHLKNMQTTLSDSDLINIKTLYISPHANQNVNRDVFFFSNIFIFFKIAFFLICCLHAFNKKIKPLNLSLFFKLNLLFDLHLQLVKSLSLKKFVQIQSKTKLIGADYDRGSDSSLFFAVSKSLNIKSFTFQHGVINPPVGYSPVNADEIWVWGGMAKMQLMELNVPEVKIRITGTPIVQDIEISNEIKQSAEIRYGFKHGSNIVLALSVPNKQNDIRLVEFLYHIKSEYGDENYNFCVKIHPARNYEEYKWIKDIYNIDILPHDIPYQDFINFVDVLLSHSSGLAAEVLFFKKKVGILDILDESPGNGIELNKYFRVSLIQQASDFEKLINDPTTNISETLFYKVGYDAKKEIQKNIEYLIA